MNLEGQKLMMIFILKRLKLKKNQVAYEEFHAMLVTEPKQMRMV